MGACVRTASTRSASFSGGGDDWCRPGGLGSQVGWPGGLRQVSQVSASLSLAFLILSVFYYL